MSANRFNWRRGLGVTRVQRNKAARPVTQADHALIRQAIADGRVTVCPPRHGVSPGFGYAPVEREIEGIEVRDLIRLQVSA